MNTLILDTSSETEILCLKKEDTVYDASCDTGLFHSVNLLDTVDTVLEQSGLALRDISLLGCGIGPGSFTGIRIAVTTSRMISQLTGIPVVGIRSLRMYLFHPRFKPGDLLLAAYDAKKKRVFGAVYRVDDDPFSPEVLVEEGDYPMERLLSVCADKTVYGVGSGSLLYEDLIRTHVARYTFLQEHRPDPMMLCSYVEKQYEHKRQAETYNALTPFYARLSDAEAMRRAKSL